MLDQWRTSREPQFYAAVDFISYRGKSDVLAGCVDITPTAADGIVVLCGSETGCVVDEIDGARGVLCSYD